MKKIFHVVFLFCYILFFNNQVFAVIQDDKLVMMLINCGKSSSGRRSAWSDSFYATTTEHTFQGSRYWGGKTGGVGYEIFSAFKTKKKLIINVKGREAGDRWGSKFISDGDMSIIEHLSKGIKGTRGKKDPRKCELRLTYSAPIRSAIAVENIRKNYNLSFEKVEKLEKEIIELKKQVSLLNTSLESEKKKQKIAEGKLKEQEKKQKVAEEKLKAQEKKQKVAEGKLKKQEKDQKIAEEKRIAEEENKKLLTLIKQRLKKAE